MTPAAPPVAGVLDLDRYPVDRPGDPHLAEVVERGRGELAETGMAVLPGFLRPEAVADICRRVAALEPLAHRQDVLGTPYLAPPDPALPAEHPRNRTARSSVEVLAYDRFPADDPLRLLYEWDPLLDLLARLLERSPIYRYADPLGALNVAVMRCGDRLGWHFDMADFVVSIALQSPAAGGEFQAVPALRSPDDEHEAEVVAVLDADDAHPSVLTVPMIPGTLLLFQGRNALHRVAPVVGPVPRYVALLAYDTEPGTDSTPSLKLMRYGRTAPVPPEVSHVHAAR